MSGHYRMHRGWLDHPALDDREPFCKRAAWVWLIDHANWKAGKIDIGGKPVAVERGQLCHSYRHLAKAWNWSVCKVQLFLERLENHTMVSTDSSTGRLVITICNYDKYQALTDVANTPDNTVANTDPVRDQYNTKEGKKGKKKSNGEDSCGSGERGAGERPAPTSQQIDIEEVPGVKPAPAGNVVPMVPTTPSKGRYRLPEVWQPPMAWMDEAATRGHTNPVLAGMKFHDHWRRKAAANNPYAAKSDADWRTAYLAWIADDVMKGTDHGRVSGQQQHREPGSYSRDVGVALFRREAEEYFGR